MNKKEQDIILNKLSVLAEQKLNQVSRAGTMIDLGFGKMIKKKVAHITQDGKYEIKETLTSRYALQIDCSFRITCGSAILLSKCDIFQPSSELLNTYSFDEENFEWDNSGANRFDENAKNHFTENKLKFTVKKITTNKFGDLKIALSNDLFIEIFVDTSENEECWRFFEAGDIESQHLVVNGKGLNEE